MEPERRQILLVEYQKAQDSAEHHDNLVGSVTSLWLGSAILIGFVLTALASPEATHFKSVLCLVIVLGMFLTILALTWAERAGERKIEKYNRCKEIEELLGMEQHTRTAERRHWQTWAYRLLVLFFVATWGALLLEVIRR
jgi:hypothetical protein